MTEKWQGFSSLKKNLPFVHPEQDEPFDRKDRDLLEQYRGTWQNPADPSGEHVHERTKMNKAREHVNENRIHTNDG